MYRLGPGALDKIDSGTFETLEPEEKLIFRVLQGAEYQEFEVAEEDLEKLLLWQARVQADTLLLDMLYNGKIFWAGFADDGDDGNSYWTSSPLGRSLMGDESELPQI